MESSVAALLNEIDSNKENKPPKEEKAMLMMKKKKPIRIVAPSFKKKGNRKTSKRVPLADITNLFRNSALLTTIAHEGDGGSAVPSASSDSDSVVLNSNPRRRTMVVAPGSKSKTLRLGFR